MPTDKELIELADKGLLSTETRARAIKAYYVSLLGNTPTIKEAVLTTANKFKVSESTVRNTIKK